MTFDANGGSPAPNQITGLSYQEKITAPEEPARPAIRFKASICKMLQMGL